MRFKKGSKVEVFSTVAVPAGFWRCAEIVCGNGHNYTVRYDMAAVGEPAFEMVSRQLIRPCPPPVELSENWIPGDVVEVLHDYSWKMATVSKILRGNCFMVRLVGSSKEFTVSKIDVRLRQSWTNGKWIIVGKDSGNSDDHKYNERSPIIFHQISGVKEGKTSFNPHDKKNYFSNQNNENFQESCIVPSRTLKRSPPYCYSQARAHEGRKKFRAIEKDGRCHRVTAADLSSVPENADRYVYTLQLPGEMNEERTRINGAVKNSWPRTLECDGSVSSSVGSCTMASNPREWPPRFLACHKECAEDHSSDAESTCQMPNKEVNCFVPSEEELAAEIHRLELHAYRCTMEALHALGPLSWEQETLVTNLRISLHISNDEHLTEIRNLISKATSIPTR